MRPKSKVFEHFTTHTVNNKVTFCCKYCNTVYLFKNATKFACHLSKCAKTPCDVQCFFKNREKNKSSSAASESHGEPSGSTHSHIPYQEPNQDSTMSDVTDNSSTSMSIMNTAETVGIHQAITRAIYVTGSPFSLFEHPLWKEAFQKVNPLYKLPSRKQLATTLLDKEYAKVELDVTDKIKRASVLHVAIDGWSNIRKEPIINVIVYTPKPLFYKFIETDNNRHTSEYLCNQVSNIMEEFDTSKFFGVVTDNAANMVRFGKLLHDKYSQTQWTGCLAHTLHLLIGDILKILKIRKLLKHIVNVIKTISSSHILGAEYRRIAEEKSVNITLHLPVKTRWGSYLFCLQSFLKSKVVLQNMAVNMATGPLRRYKIELLNEDVWSEVQDLEIVLKPIVQWILMLEGDYHAVHLVHKAFNDLHKLLDTPTSKNFLEDSLPTFKNKFEERKLNALKPLHLAAAILDPKNQGACLTNEEHLDGCDVIINMTDDDASDILVDFANYKSRKDMYEKDFLWKMAEKVEPVVWWETLFSKTALGKIALKVLSVPATSAAVERSFSTFSHIHSKKRNRLKTNRAGKVTFISHNWKLINKPTPQKPAMPILSDCVWDSGDASSDSEDDFSDIVDIEESSNLCLGLSDTEVENITMRNAQSSDDTDNSD